MRSKIKITGFTLIELLVTIVIIGILSTLSLSTFQGYFEKARLASAQFSANQIKRLFLAQNASTEANIFTSWYTFDSDDVQQTNPYVLDRGAAENNLVSAWSESGASFSDIEAVDDTGIGIGKSLKLTTTSLFRGGGNNITNRPIESLTFAFWMKINRTNTSPSWITYPMYITSTVSISVRANSSLRFDMGVYEIETDAGAIKQDLWHYVVASYNSDGTLKLWLDGQLVGHIEGATVGTWGSTSDLVFGRYGTGSIQLDEFMLMPYAFNGENLR